MMPNILALDFDGVLCDGMHEYFEASRRSYARIWTAETQPSDDAFPAFRRLRPVIMTGWEMPLLLRALALGHTEDTLEHDWEKVRDALLSADPRGGEGLARLLTQTLDTVRRDWIAADRSDWLAHHKPYIALEKLQRRIAEPERTVLVTTKEGEFARQILDAWGLRLAGIEGKEAGTHKCDNLRRLIEEYMAVHGQRPSLWFVEDRLETLHHVTTHPDLDDVGLFLAAWGYNTLETRASVQDDRRIHVLALDRFSRGLPHWLGHG